MNTDASEYLLYSATAVLLLALIARGLFYLNGRLEGRHRKRQTVKQQNHLALQLVLLESAAYPQLQPLPSYEEVTQLEGRQEMRFKRPSEVKAEQPERWHPRESQSTVMEMPPPAYFLLFK